MIERLDPISSEAMEEFQTYKEDIIKETVHQSLGREEEVQHHGEEAEKLITQGIEFTTKMLESAMLVGEPLLLEDELNWAKDRLPHDGVALEHVLSRFQIYRQVVKDKISPEHAPEIVSYLDWMITQLKTIIQKEK